MRLEAVRLVPETHPFEIKLPQLPDRICNPEPLKFFPVDVVMVSDMVGLTDCAINQNHTS
jgi:hypothetical protein